MKIIPYSVMLDKDFDKRRQHLIRIYHHEEGSNVLNCIATYNMKNDKLTITNASESELFIGGLKEMLKEEKEKR